MASEIEIMIQQLRSVQLETVVPEIIEATQDVITGYVKDQLKEGRDARGKIAPRYKSDYYARKKFAQNSAPGLGTPDAYVTGTYYASIEVLADKQDYITDSNITRKNLLQYGEDLLRMSDENKSKYAQGTLLQEIIKRYRTVGIRFD